MAVIDVNHNHQATKTKPALAGLLQLRFLYVIDAKFEVREAEVREATKRPSKAKDQPRTCSCCK